MTTDRSSRARAARVLGRHRRGPASPTTSTTSSATASHRRQRPAWTFPERWLPVDIVTQPAPTAGLPWRRLGILALLARHPRRAPSRPMSARNHDCRAPFGTAANGLVAYDDGRRHLHDRPDEWGRPDGDRHRPRDSTCEPIFSRDGTRIAFERTVKRLLRPRAVRRVSADGRELIPVTREPVEKLAEHWRSHPTGSEVLLTSVGGTPRALLIPRPMAGANGRSMSGWASGEPSFRPPERLRDPLRSAASSRGWGNGLYAVDLATSVVRTIVTPVDRCRSRRGPGLAGRLAHPVLPRRSTRTARTYWRTHVVRHDGTGRRRDATTIRMPCPMATAVWSNDGTRLIVTRILRARRSDHRAAVIPVDGADPASRYPTTAHDLGDL